MNIRPVVHIFAILLCCNTGLAFDGEEKIIDQELFFAAKGGAFHDVLIRLEGSSELAEKEYTTTFMMQEDRLEIKALVSDFQSKAASDNVRFLTAFENLPVLHARVSAKGLQELAASGRVMSIESNRINELSTNQGISLMLPGSYESFRTDDGGKGITIAVIDTGVNYNHPFLGNGRFPSNVVTSGYDFGDNDSDPLDNHGHGTACISIAAGRGNNGDYIGGVAPKAKVAALKVSRTGGRGLTRISHQFRRCQVR